MVGRLAELLFTFRVVLDDELQRVEHGDAARCDLVEVLAHAVFEHRDVDPRIGLGHADALGEGAEALGRVAAPACAHQRGEARVVPAVDALFLDELDELAFGQHHVGQVEPRELDLLRQRSVELAAVGQLLVEPVVQRAMVLELERADRVRDVLDRVRHAVRPVVGRVEAPRVAGAVVVRVPDPVHGRVAQVDVGRVHVDLRAQDMRAVRVLAGLHLAQQLQVLFDAAIAERAVAAALGEGAARGAHFFCALAIDIRKAARHQVLGERVELVEVVGGEELVAGAVGVPRKPEPVHGIDDRVDVLLLFLGRVGVVEAQVAHAAEVAREAEVEADALGVAVVQVAVGFRREARADLCPVAACGVLARSEVVLDDAADEIRAGGGRSGCVGHNPEV